MKKLYGWEIFNGRSHVRFKSLLRFLAVWLGVIAILSISQVAVSASEKPEIFVQLVKKSI